MSNKDTDPIDYLMISDHNHQFTVPVEWEFMGMGKTTWGEGISNWHQPSRKRVTRLRCALCPEEVRRV